MLDSTAEPTRLKRYFPATIEIDGREIRLRIKRLDLGEAAHFDRLLTRAQTDEAERMLSVRKPGEEQAKHAATAITGDALAALTELFTSLQRRMDTPTPESPAPTAPDLLELLGRTLKVLTPTDQFVIDLHEIKARRWAELDDAGRAKLDVLQKRDEAAFDLFLKEACGKYIQVEPGQLLLEEEVDGQPTERPVLTGEDLGRCYGARHGLVNQLVRLVRSRNKLAADEKNDSRSRSASVDSSTGSNRDRTPATPGASPAPTVPPAASTDSATSAAATTSTGG